LVALGLGGVGAGVGPVAGQGAVEAFDLAVGLGTVGAGALGLDTQLLAGGFLDLGAVGGIVVGQDSLYPDSSGAKP